MNAVVRRYRVLPVHREEVAGIEVTAGQILFLTDAEALYELDLNQIELIDQDPVPPPPPPDPVQGTDVISLLRNRLPYRFNVETLSAYILQRTTGQASDAADAAAIATEKAAEAALDASEVAADRVTVEQAREDAQAARTATEAARDQANSIANSQAPEYLKAADLPASGSAPTTLAAYVTDDGTNNGRYIRATATSTWEKKSSVTVPALDARLLPVEDFVTLQAKGSTYELIDDGSTAHTVTDDDGRLLLRLRASGYEYFLPAYFRRLTAERQVCGGQEILFLDSDEYAGSGQVRALVDEDNRILPTILGRDASRPMEAVPLRQLQRLLSTTTPPPSTTLLLRRGTLSVAILGDSRTDNAFAGSARLLMQPRAYPFWVQMLSRGAVRFRSDWNFGIAGQNTDQILARVDAALVTAADADAFVILCETNDSTGANSIANVTSMVDKILAAGKMAWLVAELPRGDTGASTWDQTRINQHLKFMRTMLRLASRPGVRVIDPWPALLDPTSSLAGPKPNTMYDNLHLTCFGALLLGQVFWDSVRDLARTAASLLLTNFDVFNSTSNPLGNIVVNGMMAGTGGTKSGTGSITGSVADNWDLAATNSYGVTASKVVQDGFEWQRIALSGTAANASQQVRLSQSLALSKFSAGDVVEMSSEIYVDAGSVGLYGPDFTLVVDGVDTTLSVGSQPPASTTSANPDVAWGGPFISQRFTIPSGATSIAIAVQVKGKQDAAMSGAFRASRIDLRKL